jgi:hypothetical protein
MYVGATLAPSLARFATVAPPNELSRSLTSTFALFLLNTATLPAPISSACGASSLRTTNCS